MTDDQDHQSEVTYTTDDDGIYLRCTACRVGQYNLPWETHLGFGASVDDIVTAWTAHVAERR